MEIELNFRLDQFGRTSASDPHESDRVRETNIDYTSKTAMTNLAMLSDSSDEKDQQRIDDILFDAEITDCGILPRTFWVPAQGMSPRCSLEQFAFDVFHHHVPKGMNYDIETSGAEWWVQIRPSPPETGRYSMHDDPNDDDPNSISKTGVSFHWDKDEDLRLLTDGSTYIHPHLSTVTYLTDLGCPTLVLNSRVQNLTGDWIVPGDESSPNEQPEGFVSWPKAGKHLSFDGRYLHAAPPDLMEPGAFKRQIQFCEGNKNDPKQRKIQQRRHRRVTFLVNIWLNYQPFDVKPFPEGMVDKLSGRDETIRLHLEVSDSMTTNTHTVSVGSSTSQLLSNGGKTIPRTIFKKAERFTWPMGDCDSNEILEASIPLGNIREQAPSGGNIRIQWALASNDNRNVDYSVALLRNEQKKDLLLAATKREGDHSSSGDTGDKRFRRE